MKDILTKIHILYFFISDAIHGWKKEIWKRDINDYYCCNGEMCGCRGSSIREVYYGMHKIK